MPRQIDQLPADATTLARKVKALEEQMRELRAARRMGTATVGRLRVYSEDGGTLLAELGPMDNGECGLWTRGAQDDDLPVSATLAGGELRFRPIEDGVNEVPASATYTSLPDSGSDLTLVSGAVRASDWRSVVDLGSVVDGSVPNVLVAGLREVDGVAESGACNMDVSGVLTAANIACGSVLITPSAANTPTSATISGLDLKGSSFFAWTTPLTTVPGTSVTGTSATAITSSGLTVWVTRTSTTATTVFWLVIGL
ncbi:hypothetical protein ACFY30_22300 [Streptomyces sp. NPDC000345]|uniref:hypothetical protein n=1 Tax=Streptomyces sp. NPDC000345 TaxID=3364537 RepID=UPI003698B678